jgi:hypothetical protein
MSIRSTAALAAVLACLAPASAAAQSAGDEQYEDPFADEQTTNDDGGGEARETAQTPDEEDGLSESPPQPLDDSQEPAQPAQPAQPSQPEAAQPAQLANTGSDPWLIGSAGAGLVLTGAGLRLRVRADGRRTV